MSGSVYDGDGRRRSKMSAWNSRYEIDNDSQCSAESSTRLGSDELRSPDIRQRVHSLFQKQLYTDVKFVINCGTKPKPFLLAHKAILAVGSPKFAEMLFGEDRCQQDEIQLSNILYRAFASVVDYLYTDDVYFESDSQVMEILAAAKTFEVNSLVMRCESYLESSEITEANVCTKLQLATKTKAENLKQRCTEFIQENTADVIRSFNFKTVDLSTIRAICKFPKFNLSSEQELFHGIMEWVDEQESHGKSKRELVEPLLRHIRFLTLPCEEFNQLVSKYPNIFKAEEALNIFMYLSSPNNNKPNGKLPGWCNQGTNRCESIQGVQCLQENRNHPNQKVSIGFKSVESEGDVDYVRCILEMKCKQGQHKITAIKLAFDEPVMANSSIERLIITVSTEPSKFTFKEHIRLLNSKTVTVPFTRRLLARRGDTVYIQATANDVKNYRFLQYDHDYSFLEPSPFECAAGSVPKGKKLFFISEVIFEDVRPSRLLPQFRTRQ